MTVPLAPDCRLVPAPDLRTLDGGRILIGGAPFRILRLRPGGAGLVRRWFAGEPVGDRPANHELARRLEAAGMAHVRWPPADPDAVRPSPTVIIPTHDDEAELRRTLTTLTAPPERWAAEVIVVDDGSARAVDIVGRGITLIRRPVGGGPGAARQTGLEATSAEIVVFLDAGVTLEPDDAAGLVAAFDDPAVVAAAPRVHSEPGEHVVARYERHRSPIDLGPRESLVGPGRAVTYVPTACLAVRTEAIRAVGGFDRGLRYGEDVDLVWRLGQVGSVRYLPWLRAVHRPRSSVVALLEQRRSYGSAAAALATRHGHRPLSPCLVSPWSALVLTLLLARRPMLAGTTAIATGLALGPKLEPMPDARAEALALTLRGHWYGGLAILTAIVRSWFPVALAALAFGGRPRRMASTALVAAVLRRGLDGPRQPTEAAIDLSLGLADDLAYGAGLWQGAVAERSIASLRPVLSSWPGGGSGWRRRLADLRPTLWPTPRRRRAGAGA